MSVHAHTRRPRKESTSIIGSVLRVSSGTRESEMSLGGDDRTKHHINSSTRDRGKKKPTQEFFCQSNFLWTDDCESKDAWIWVWEVERCAAGRQGSAAQVVRDLPPCFSADHEHLRALYDAGVDEHDHASGSPAKAVSLVDEPLVDNQLHDFGAVREGSSEAGFALLVFELGALSFQPLQPTGCHIRLDVEFSFPVHQKLDHPTDLAQLFVSFLVHRGLGVPATGPHVWLHLDELASRDLRVSLVFLAPVFSPLDETSTHLPVLLAPPLPDFPRNLHSRRLTFASA